MTIFQYFFVDRAPAGCLQYFYGDTRHTFTSFNWDGTTTCSSGCLIKDQAYTICFRPERGIDIMRTSRIFRLWSLFSGLVLILFCKIFNFNIFLKVIVETQ